MFLVIGEIKFYADRTRRLTFYRGNGSRLECSQTCGCEVACYTINTESIRPVRCDCDVNHGIIQMRVINVARANRGIRG